MIIAWLTAVTVLIAAAITIATRGNKTAYHGMMALAWWVNAAGDLIVWHTPVFTCITVPMAIFWTWQWWNNRKNKRRKTRALIGAKTRALRDKLIRKVAERRVRRPILVPS